MARLKGSGNKDIKYSVLYHDLIKNKWVKLGEFTTFSSMGKKLKVSGSVCSKVFNKKVKVYNNFFKIKQIRK